MPLKKDSSPEFIAKIQAIETRADQSFANLALYSYPHNIASWVVLVFLVQKTEELQSQFGTRNLSAGLLNLGRRGSLVLRWLRDGCAPDVPVVQERLVSESLLRAVDQAMEVARRYDRFLGIFPMWHRDKAQAELQADGAIAFTDMGATLERRISAFQKGFVRPGVAGNEAPTDGVAISVDQADARDAALARCVPTGPRSMSYPEPEELYRLFYVTYLARLNNMFRRADSVALGNYTMGDFRSAYAALTAVAAVHSDLCYRYGASHGYPLNSCVMVRSSSDWARLLAGICSVPLDIAAAVVRDLTLRDRFWEMQVHPFVQIEGDALAMAPPFPLASRADENILRVINHTKRPFFDRAAQLKEEEMLADLLDRLPPHLAARTRVPLPCDLPDIDLLLVDEGTGTLLIAELKWLQKPSAHWKERLDREADFEKGVEQLARIRSFLERSPAHLCANGIATRRFGEYQRVAFVLIARDFFVSPNSNQVIVVDHEVFKEAVATGSDLVDLLTRIERYAWLPVEGMHFRVERERQSLNGVAIELDVYYRI